MRYLIASMMLLGLAAPEAYARCEVCDPKDDPPEVPTCPSAFPRPTDASVCACKAAAGPARCNGALSQAACNGQTANALAVGLLTADAQTWLTTNGWCPIVINGALAGICPNGCFDAETQILTAMTSDGTARYTPAAQLAAHTPLMTLSDEAGLDAVDLVSRPVSRVVSGPEEPPLFAFALSSGATLRVTSHHPMVLDSGAIVEAADVPLGSAFIGIDGAPVAVTAITRELATGDVFNYETTADSQIGHVMVAHDVLVGDLKLQNELAGEANLIELRR